MRLKIHEHTVKLMSKLLQGDRMHASDDLGNIMCIEKIGPFVRIEVKERFNK